MFRWLKKLFLSRRPRDHRATSAEDQLDLPNARRNSPASSEASVIADTEATNLLSQSYFDSAQKLRRTFPPTCSWLESEDLDFVGESPMASGRYADIWKGRLDGRDVVIKTYRCYISFDCDWIRMVSYDYDPHRPN